MATRFLSKSFSPLLASGLCQLVIALATLLSVSLLDEMPYFYLKAHEMLIRRRGLLNLEFLLAAGLMLGPTLGWALCSDHSAGP